MLVAFFVGCGGLPASVDRFPDELERTAIAVTMQTWNEDPALQPIGPQCIAELRHLRVAFLGPPEYRAACGECTYGAHYDAKKCKNRLIYGCFRYRHPEGKDGPHIPIMVVWEMAEDPVEVLMHETVHWLGSCTGRGPDGRHIDPLMWGDDGVLGRAREKALSGF